MLLQISGVIFMIVLGHSTALHETFKHRIHLRVLLINAQIVKKKFRFGGQGRRLAESTPVHSYIV